MAEVARLSVRTEHVAGTITDHVRVARGSIRNKTDLVIFVHGFNNDEAKALLSFDRCKDVLQRQYGVPHTAFEDRAVMFYWPGDQSPHRPVSTLGYFRQVSKALKVGRRLAAFLNNHAQSVPRLKLTFIAHSLGCRVVLETASKLRHCANIELAAAYLLAAAVPVSLCQPDADGHGAYPSRATNVEIAIYSEADTALRHWFPIGQTLARDGGFMPEAVGRYGRPRDERRDSSAQRWTHTVKTVLGHGEYWIEPESLDVVVSAFGRVQPWALPKRVFDELQLAGSD